MNLDERTKEVILTNPTGKKKGKKKKHGGKRKRKGGGKKKGGASRRRGSSGSSAKPKKRRKYKKNPSVDVKGLLKAQAGGLAGMVVAQTAAHLANSAALKPNAKGESHPTLAKILRITVPEVLGLALGAGASMISPNAGKGIAAAGAAVAGMHGLSVLATSGDKPPEWLAKAGFAQLGAMEDYYVDNGHVYKRGADGEPQLMFGTTYVPLELEDHSGNVFQVSGVGNLPEGALIMRDGKFQLIPGIQLNGLQTRTDLSGVQRRTDLSGVDSRGGTDFGMR